MEKYQTISRRFLTKQQSRIPIMFLMGLLAFSALILFADSASRANDREPSTNVSQTALSGQWIARFNTNKPAVINLMFTRQSENGGSYMVGENVSLNELQGFPSDVTSSAKTNINFRIVREAGTFDCEGYFGASKGAGFWTLTPSQSFVSMIRGRGYGNLTDEDLLRAALHNLTTKFIVPIGEG